MRKLMIILFALSLSIVTACGPNHSASKSNDKASSSKSKAAGSKQTADSSNPFAKPVTLVFYSLSRDSKASFDKRFGNMLEKHFPNLKIKYVKRVAHKNDLPQMLASGQQMDIVWGSLGSWPGLLDNKVPADLTQLVKKENVDLSTIEPTMVDAVKKMGGGKLYGIPIENSTMVMYYNKDIFDKFGVSYPKDGMTWAQLNALSKKIDRINNGKAYVGYAPDYEYIGLSNEYSVPQVDQKTYKSTFDTNPLWKKMLQTEALTTMESPAYIKASDKYRSGSVLQLNQFLKQKDIAMFPQGPLLPEVLPKEMSQFNWGMVAMPTYADQKGVGYQSYPEIMSITKMSKHKAAAMEVLKYMISKEMQMHLSQMGDMTALTDKSVQQAMGEDGQFKGKNYGAFFYNKFAPIAPRAKYSSVPAFLEFKSLLPAVSRKQEDLNTALRKAAENVNKEIKQK